MSKISDIVYELAKPVAEDMNFSIRQAYRLTFVTKTAAFLQNSSTAGRLQILKLLQRLP